MVTVLDKNGSTLMLCTAKKARLLLKKGRASLVSKIPYAIMLKDKEVKVAPATDLQLKMDDRVLDEFQRLKSLHRMLGLYPSPQAARAAGGEGARGGGGNVAGLAGAAATGREAFGGVQDGGGARAGAAVPGGFAAGAPVAVNAGAAPRGERWQDQVILSAVEPGAYVLDLGCGRGELLARLTGELGVKGQGVEVDPEAAMTAMEAGVPVLNVDLSLVLGDFGDKSFDYVILESTLQTLSKPLEVIFEMLRVGRRGIVSFPNFGHWRVRLDLAARGRMPVTPDLPYGWHDTPNIHLFTLDDILDVCEANDLRIVSAWGLCGGEIRPVGTSDNLVTEEAILFLERRAPSRA
ncbi:MAG: methionine biosynthesis protein MetW [Deltaproteobacteria bacterium]|jgi:methionine biosynthesis protein MetW|nr:methionine biosynthesis protein MetW [Deltaproteobacteria bacterium]